MTDLSELQGEVTALRCYVAALATVVPLSSQIRLWPAFEVNADLMRDRLSREALAGFEQMAASLNARRPTSTESKAGIPGA